MIEEKIFYLVDLDEFKNPKIKKLYIEDIDKIKKLLNQNFFNTVEEAVYFLKRSIGKEILRLNQIEFDLKFLDKDKLETYK